MMPIVYILIGFIVVLFITKLDKHMKMKEEIKRDKKIKEEIKKELLKEMED